MRFLLFTFLFFLVTNLWAQNDLKTLKANSKSFPTNIDGMNLKTLKDFNEEVVAFDGIIKKVENSNNNTPSYKLKIKGGGYLWTVLMFKNEANKKGDKIRVLGYLRQIVPSGREQEYLDGKYTVIVFGLVDFKKSKYLFVDGVENLKQEWLEEEIPSSK